MKNLKSFTLGVITTALVATCGVSALAASGAISISVNPNITIKVNGDTFQPKDVNGKDVMVFEYNGTTYAPLRALAEAYGLQVGWDQAAQMATVDEPGSVPDTDSSDSSLEPLVDMSFIEIDSIFTKTYESDKALDSPKDSVVLYYFEYTYKGNDQSFPLKWNDFSQSGKAEEYMEYLTKRLSKTVPYNTASVSIYYNGQWIASAMKHADQNELDTCVIKEI